MIIQQNTLAAYATALIIPKSFQHAADFDRRSFTYPISAENAIMKSVPPRADCVVRSHVFDEQEAICSQMLEIERQEARFVRNMVKNVNKYNAIKKPMRFKCRRGHNTKKSAVKINKWCENYT